MNHLKELMAEISVEVPANLYGNAEVSPKMDAAVLAQAMADEAIIIDAAEHAYLANKRYAGFEVFKLSKTYRLGQYTYGGDCLLHPICNEQGEIISAELVSREGRKTALAGGSKAGATIIYPLSDNDDPDVVFVCEGVATGYAVRELLGGNAIGFAGLSKGGLMRAAKMAELVADGRPVIVCGDTGAEREAEAAATAIKARVSFPPSGDWDDYRQDYLTGGSMSEISPILASAREPKADTGLELPAHHEQPKPKVEEHAEVIIPSKLDAGELAEIMRGHPLVDLAISMAGVVQFPRDSAVLAACTIASSAISDVYRVKFKDHAKPICTGIYSLIAQPPGSGKSAIFSKFLDVLDDERSEANADIKKWASSYNDARDEEDQRQFRLLATSLRDTTPEALDGALTRTDGSFFAASDEQTLANSLIGGAYGQNGKPVNNGVILSGFCGERAATLRVTREGYTGYVHGAVCCVTQSGVIETVATSSNGTGVAERFIMLDEPSLLGYRNRGKVRQRVKEELSYAYEQAITKLVAMARDRAKSLVTVRHWQDMPNLTLSNVGFDMVAEFDSEIEPQLRNDGAYGYGLLQGAASKSDYRVAKFAAVLHVFDCLMNGREVSPVISDEWVEVGVKVARWSLNCMKQAIEKGGIAGKSVEVELVVAHVAKQGDKGIPSSAVAQYLRKRAEFKGYGEEATKRVHAAIDAAINSGDIVRADRCSGRKPVSMLFGAGYEPIYTRRAAA